MLCESVLCYLNVERLRLPNDNNMAAVHPPYYHCCLLAFRIHLAVTVSPFLLLPDYI